MPVGGYRPGSGRKKGTRNRDTLNMLAEIEQSGLTPLQYLLEVMRDTSRDDGVRIDAAKAAAPYVHAKLAQVEHSGPEGGPLQISIVTYAAVDPV